MGEINELFEDDKEPEFFKEEEEEPRLPSLKPL